MCVYRVSRLVSSSPILVLSCLVYQSRTRARFLLPPIHLLQPTCCCHNVRHLSPLNHIVCCISIPNPTQPNPPTQPIHTIIECRLLSIISATVVVSYLRNNLTHSLTHSLVRVPATTTTHAIPLRCHCQASSIDRSFDRALVLVRVR